MASCPFDIEGIADRNWCGRPHPDTVRNLASLQDACDFADRSPVVSSLRSSTTGYCLSSLQLDAIYSKSTCILPDKNIEAATIGLVSKRSYHRGKPEWRAAFRPGLPRWKHIWKQETTALSLPAVLSVVPVRESRERTMGHRTCDETLRISKDTSFRRSLSIR